MLYHGVFFGSKNSIFLYQVSPSSVFRLVLFNAYTVWTIPRKFDCAVLLFLIRKKTSVIGKSHKHFGVCSLIF